MKQRDVIILLLLLFALFAYFYSLQEGEEEGGRGERESPRNLSIYLSFSFFPPSLSSMEEYSNQSAWLRAISIGRTHTHTHTHTLFLTIQNLGSIIHAHKNIWKMKLIVNITFYCGMLTVVIWKSCGQFQSP